MNNAGKHVVFTINFSNKQEWGRRGLRPPVEDGKTLGGQGVKAGGPFDHGLGNGEAVLTVQGQALVQTDQEDAEDSILVYRNLSID